MIDSPPVLTMVIRQSSPSSRLVRAFAVLVLAVLLGRCQTGGDQTLNVPFAIASPTTSRELQVGDHLQLSAAGASGPVAWSSSDTTIATVTFGDVVARGAGTVTIVATSGAATASITLTVTRPALIAPAASGTSFATTAGAPLPAPQHIAIGNGGDYPVTGLAVAGVAYGPGASQWLTASLDRDSAPATLTLQPSTTSLPPGTYTANLSLNSSTAANSPARLTVTYVVQPAPVIVLATQNAAFTAARTAAVPAPQTIAITSGGGTLTGLTTGPITYSPEATGWLSASVSPGNAPSTLTLQPTTTALAEGTHTATVPVIAGSGAAPVNVRVTYVVTTGPAIALGAANVSFNAVRLAGVPPAQSVSVGNGGSGSLAGLSATIAYVAGSGWLSITSGPGGAAPTAIGLQPNTTALSPGIYTANVRVTSPVAGNSPQTIAVTYTVAPSPAIALASATASFTARQTAAAPPAQTIAVTNGGGGTLAGLAVGTVSYSAGASGWLSASLSSATAPATLTLQPNTTGIAPGTYTATVPLTSTSAGASAASVTVTYQVTTAPTQPTIVLSATNLSATAPRGAALPPAQSVTVTDGGELALTGLAAGVSYVNGTGWLSITSGPGGTAPTSLTVQPNTTTLAPGTYRATVVVTSPVATNSPRAIAFTYVVQAPPTIVLSASALNFTAVGGAATPPAAQSVSITDGGDLPLTGLADSVSYVNGSGWLSVSSAPGGTAPTSISLRPNTAALSPGIYHATVQIKSPVAINSPQVISVTYTVQAPPSIVLSVASLSFSATYNTSAPSPQSVTVTDGGDLPLTGLADSIGYLGATTGWLSITSPPGGTAPTSIGLQPNTTTLSPGTYRATVQITSPVAANSPQTITVTYTVQPVPFSTAWPAITAARAGAGAFQCTTCHNPGYMGALSVPNPLLFTDTAGSAAKPTVFYNSAVSQPVHSGACISAGRTLRVAPSDTAHSCLYYFMSRGVSSADSAGHPGGTMTNTSSNLQIIRDWIMSGANP